MPMSMSLQGDADGLEQILLAEWLGEELNRSGSYLLRPLPFTDIPDITRKYRPAILDQFSQRDLHWKLFSILVQPDQLGAFPVPMPHAGTQVAPESSLMHFAHEFRHEHSQGFPNQLG